MPSTDAITGAECVCGYGCDCMYVFVPVPVPVPVTVPAFVYACVCACVRAYVCVCVRVCACVCSDDVSRCNHGGSYWTDSLADRSRAYVASAGGSRDYARNGL